MVRKYDPRTVEVKVRHGETMERKLPYHNVVKSLQRIGFFAGEDAIGLIAHARKIFDACGIGSARLRRTNCG